MDLSPDFICDDTTGLDNLPVLRDDRIDLSLACSLGTDHIPFDSVMRYASLAGGPSI